MRSSSRSRASETFLRSETVSSTFSGKTLPLFYFFQKLVQKLVLPAAWRWGPSALLGEVWHPGSLCHPWERECVFMGRMLCPYDPRVNPAVICAIKVLTSVWRGKLFVFTACLVRVRWLKADFPFTRFPHHERGKHMLWCHIVCLIPIKCSISMQSRQRLTVCAIAILSMVHSH